MRIMLKQEQIQRMEEKRIRCGYTKRDVSLKLGYAVGWYSTIAAGKRKSVELSSLQRLAEVFDCDICDLISDECAKDCNLGIGDLMQENYDLRAQVKVLQGRLDKVLRICNSD